MTDTTRDIWAETLAWNTGVFLIGILILCALGIDNRSTISTLAVASFPVGIPIGFGLRMLVSRE